MGTSDRPEFKDRILWATDVNDSEINCFTYPMVDGLPISKTAVKRHFE